MQLNAANYKVRFCKLYDVWESYIYKFNESRTSWSLRSYVCKDANVVSRAAKCREKEPINTSTELLSALALVAC